MSAAAEKPTEKLDFKSTLNLPKTDFPLRAETKKNDPLMLKRWEQDDLASAAQRCNAGAQKFILHDGPPYANGDIHLGHAYNKILKDIIAKSRRMMGCHAPVVPGWDCHGLPIEQKVSQEQPHVKGAPLMAACRAYAQRWVNVQRDELIQLGVLMDWQNPYITMAPAYEAATLRVFAKLVRAGFVERKNKTIPWCPTCRTALASAEIEYEDRTDPSIYVLFELEQNWVKENLPTITAPVSLVVWTTTPWTLPLNRAVLLKEGADYQLIKAGGRFLIVGRALAEKFRAVLAKAGIDDVSDQAVVPASQFVGAQVHHPVVHGQLVPVIVDPSVALDEGTACVHCAPGCGPSDYEVAVKNGLEIYSPLTSDGRYARGIAPAELEGMLVADGQAWVQKMLETNGTLLFSGKITHSYPHCWRCHQGLIFRATPQWFCLLNHENAKARALNVIEQMAFYPAQGKNFLRATVDSRWEWCLSRQREWGTPIPALLGDAGSVFIDADFIEKIADRVATEGIEYWSRVTIEELAQDGLLSKSFLTGNFKKETDILDVWFDAGVSHQAVLSVRPELVFPADLYLEGVDQHRGWFQSSLLTGIMLGVGTPTRAIMTHGFTVDETGKKMSKSLGNVIAPQQVIDAIGTDGLRLWVASVGNEGDAVISEQLIQNVGQVYRKVRNTCRFLIQNLFDFDPVQHAVTFDKLEPFDRYALRRLWLLSAQVIAAYERYDLTAVYKLLNEYCTVEISALYGDVVKDILYCDAANGPRRRSIQTAFSHILDTVVKLMAPIMSFAAEEASDYYQKGKTRSIHLQPFVQQKSIEQLFAGVDLERYDREWDYLLSARVAIMKLIEEQRAAGLVHHPLEAVVTITVAPEHLVTVVPDLAEFLQYFLIVSRVTRVPFCDGLVATAVPGICARVERVAGVKCPRCWQWSDTTDARGLCARCQRVVGE